MQKFAVLDSEFIIDEPYCHIEKQRVQLPDDSETNWYIKHSADAVIVVPVSKTGEILLQRNYKHGSGQVVTEFCAGMVDPGERPEQAAARELQEETGYEAGSMHFLGSVFANPTGSPMRYHFFCAENISISEKGLALEAAEQIEPFLVENLTAAQELICNPSTKTSVTTHAALNFYAKKTHLKGL